MDIEPKFYDLTYLRNYKHAIDEKQWAYFFMRGCEAYQNGYKRPVYLNNRAAHQWWETGYEFMENELEHLDDFYIYDGVFCMTFLAGHIRQNTNYDQRSAELGLLARRAFEGMCRSKQPPTKERNKPMAKTTILYKVIDKNIYGTQIATDSEGRIVLEIRGGDQPVAAYFQTELEEVVPYTICVQFPDRTVNFRTAKGEFLVGDVILVTNVIGDMAMGRVTKVNTKDRDAEKDLSTHLIGRVNLLSPRDVEKRVVEADTPAETSTITATE